MGSHKTTKNQMLKLHSALIKSLASVLLEPFNHLKVDITFSNNDKCTIEIQWHTKNNCTFKSVYQFYSYDENKDFLDRIVKTIYICNFEEFKNLKY